MQIVLVILVLLYIWRIYQGTKRGLIDEIGALANILMVSFGVIAAVNLIENILQKNLVGFLVSGIVLLILLIAWKVIKIVFCSLSFIAKLPLLNGLNKFFGLLAGVLEATIISWVLLTLLTSFEIYIGDVLIIEDIQQNLFVNFLYENNLLEEGLRRIINLFDSPADGTSISEEVLIKIKKM